jgi:hypothetical protein
MADGSADNLERSAVYISETFSACNVCSDCSCSTISYHTKKTKRYFFRFPGSIKSSGINYPVYSAKFAGYTISDVYFLPDSG